MARLTVGVDEGGEALTERVADLSEGLAVASHVVRAGHARTWLAFEGEGSAVLHVATRALRHGCEVCALDWEGGRAVGPATG